MRWYADLEPLWKRLANYFRFRVTSALSEGINNVIKTLKRRAYGYKNMEYFRLKILQKCRYLNSRYISIMHRSRAQPSELQLLYPEARGVSVLSRSGIFSAVFLFLFVRLHQVVT
jgi:hypothetical protein